VCTALNSFFHDQYVQPKQQEKLEFISRSRNRLKLVSIFIIRGRSEKK
jgi:hypothetical protein